MTNGQFNCKPDPKPPAEGNESDKSLALYIERLQSRGWDCADQLHEIKNVLQVNGIEITDVVTEAQIEED